MQDDQIGPKITGLDPADMARLHPSILPTKIFLVVNNLVRQLGLRLLQTCLALQGKSSIFYSYILLLVHIFLWFYVA
jgi:hypothetical protein